MYWDFPGGVVVKNAPANEEDTGLIPGRGRSHMPQNNYARAPQLLSLRSRGFETQLLSPRTATTEAARSRARVLQLLSPHAATTEACAPRALNKSSHHSKKLVHHNEE